MLAEYFIIEDIITAYKARNSFAGEMVVDVEYFLGFSIFSTSYFHNTVSGCFAKSAMSLGEHPRVKLISLTSFSFNSTFSIGVREQEIRILTTEASA